jgi:hypothetical protein
MKAPLLNIHFCGTAMDPMRRRLASLEVIKQFEDHLILSGVGAPSVIDKENHIHYPTPGMFDVDDELKRCPKDTFFHQHFSMLHRSAGVLWGEGEEDNLRYAMRCLQEKMKHVPAEKSVHVCVSGYSRGATNVLDFADMVYRQYAERVRLNIFMIDPNAGMGRQHYQHKRNVSSNVDNMYVTFNRHEKILFFQSLTIKHYLLTSPKTALFVMHVDGNHLQQEQLPFNARSDDASPAGINRILLESFFESYGAKRIGPALKRTPLDHHSKIKKEFTSFKMQPTSLDLMIDQLKSKTQDVPLKRDQNALFEKFNKEAKCSNNRYYSELSYHFMHLLNELHRMSVTSNTSEREKAAILLQSTNALMEALTPSLHHDKEAQKSALNDFKKHMNIGGYSDFVRQIIARVVGLVMGVLLGLAFGVVGCLAGFMQPETWGLSSVVYAGVGMYNGFFAGFDWGKRQVLGHQNARAVAQTVERMWQDAESQITPSMSCRV